MIEETYLIPLLPILDSCETYCRCTKSYIMYASRFSPLGRLGGVDTPVLSSKWVLSKCRNRDGICRDVTLREGGVFVTSFYYSIYLWIVIPFDETIKWTNQFFSVIYPLNIGIWVKQFLFFRQPLPARKTRFRRHLDSLSVVLASIGRAQLFTLRYHRLYRFLIIPLS